MPGSRPPTRPAGHVAGQRAVHLQRQHHRRTPAGVERPGGGVGAGPVDDVPPAPPGVPEERDVGPDGDRVAHRGEQRQVGVAVGVAVGRRPGRCRWSRPTARSHAARDSPTSGDAARKPVQTPRSSTARSAASMWSNSGASGRVSGRIAPVISTVGVAGRAVLADPAYGGRCEPRQHVVGEHVVDDRVEVGEPGAGVLAVDRAEERAALAALGADQAGQAGRDPAELAEPLAGRQLLQPHPEVGLDDVGRQQRAVHVEERRGRLLVLLDGPERRGGSASGGCDGPRRGCGSARSPPGSAPRAGSGPSRCRRCRSRTPRGRRGPAPRADARVCWSSKRSSASAYSRYRSR